MDPVAPAEAAADFNSMTNDEDEVEYAYPVLNTMEPLPSGGMNSSSDDNTYTEPYPPQGIDNPLGSGSD